LNPGKESHFPLYSGCVGTSAERSGTKNFISTCFQRQNSLAHTYVKIRRALRLCVSQIVKKLR